MATWRTDVNPHTVKMLQCVGYFYVIGQEGEILAPGWLDHDTQSTGGGWREMLASS